ncbi:UDP-N-acetylglucosamine 4,6-dehydratase, partial [Acinetobacter baumannii]
KNELNIEEDKLQVFEEKINSMLLSKHWNKEEIVDLFNYMMPNFGHKETGLYLDGKM